MCLCFAGGAIDLFYRYGFFSLSVRVVPRDDPGSWLVREPTSRVFDDTSIRRTERPGPNSFVVNPIEVSVKMSIFPTTISILNIENFSN